MKNAIRLQMREKRKSLSPALHAEKSKKIRERLEQLPEFKTAQKIMIYISLEDEVDTHEIVKDALKQGRTLYIPKIENGTITVCPLKNWGDLEPSSFGILEPCAFIDAVHPTTMDLIIVPGLAFDARGHRIGYGKGHYDRLLKQSNAYKVGLAFHEQMIDEVPSEEHDVPLDLIITDQTLIHP